MIIKITGGIRNISLQVGDVAYFIPGTAISQIGDIYHTGGTPDDISFNNTYKVGTVDSITSDSITINSPNITPTVDDFIMFRKNESVNNTSLIGYYAEVKLRNDSPDEAELFALSAEIAESSK